MFSGEVKEQAMAPEEADRSRVLVIAAVMAALFVSATSQTVVATALPRMIGDLGGLSLYSWVLTSSMLAATAAMPLVGKLSDLYGRKPFLMGGIALFMVASALTGASQNMLQLIGFRAVQGLAGGTIMASAFATIGDLFPPAERGRYFGLFTSVFGLASIAGPLLGGFITDHWGWRWVFYVNVPFGLLALAVLVKAMRWQRRAESERQAVPIDWVGMVALLWAVIPLLLALAWAGDRFPWVSVPIGALLGTAGLGLFAFIAIERGAADPVLPLSLFRERTFVVASVAAFFMGMGLFGALSYMPLFIQGVLGASATNSGLVNMPLMLGFTAASFASGMVASRTRRYRWMVIAGCLVMAGGMAVMVTLDEQANLALPIVGMIVVGLGLGLSMPLLGLAVQNALDDRLLGVATASSQFFRQIGGTLGIALFGTIITTQIRGGLVGRLPEEVTNAAPPEALRQLEEPRILLSPEALERLRGTFVSFGDGGPALYDQTLAVMRSVLADGLHEVFLVGLLVAFLTLAVSVFLPERPLRTRAAGGQKRAPAPADLIWGDASWISEGRSLHEVPVDEAPTHAATAPQAGKTGDG